MEDFEDWISRLRQMSLAFGYFWYEIKPEDWRDFYEDGLSPHDALIADLAQGR